MHHALAQEGRSAGAGQGHCHGRENERRERPLRALWRTLQCLVWCWQLPLPLTEALCSPPKEVGKLEIIRKWALPCACVVHVVFHKPRRKGQ